MKKMKIALIDDESDALQVLKRFIEISPDLELYSMTTDPLEFLEKLESKIPDVLITDIVMDKMNGIHLAEVIEKHKIPVILCSGYQEFCYDGFKVNAVDFIKKPANYSEFLKAIKKIMPLESPQVISTETKRPDYLTINENGSATLTIIKIDDIKYIQQDKNYAEIFTTKRKYLVLSSLTALVEKLPMDTFCRVHRSYVVNTSLIQSVKYDSMIINPDISIPISKNYSADLIQTLKNASLNGSSSDH
ncbi:LytR/AlgR family response regulator transcription factor [Algoriphagus pacificus]|uniref:Response regulator transcription factor n=1 Tax=Algoriphagus pacificus TaxID=2811234 RepID=A0ABS3CKZ5_9BACT|nr:LytTR family DNA-binding domain-containing protein [Algoriphagus pacificus]MBN7817767.1 response regulator transcription factor [Algoriphagus pacificus]